MNVYPKQVNLNLKSSPYITSEICKQNNNANLILYYKSKALHNKLDNILNNIQLRQRNLLYHKNGLCDNKELTSFLPLIPFSLSSRQHYNLDGSELETISQNKDTSILKKYSLRNITKQRNNTPHYKLSNKLIKSHSMSDFNTNSTFHITNNSQLTINKTKKVKPNWQTIKLRNSGKKVFHIINRNLNNEINNKNIYNIYLNMNHSDLFGNVFLRNKCFDK